MDLTKYYPDIAAKYPAYVTKRELCEICHICPKTAYNLEQQGEIPYTIEQNHLIRSHKIKLTDILAYLYRRECRQEADSPYICAMRTFYDEHLSPYSDLLSVKDIQQITGFSSSAIVRWISTGILKAFQPGKQYTVPKDFIELIVALPFEGHDSKWDAMSKQRLQIIIHNATKCIVIGQSGTTSDYKKRNYYMVDHADFLLAVYDNNRKLRSGTGQTVNYALKQNLRIIFLHPDTAEIS